MNIDEKSLIKDALKIYKKHGKLTVKLYSEYGKYSIKPILNKYGTWNNFLTALDITSNKAGTAKPKITKEQIFNDVLKVFKKYNITTREFYLSHGKYSRSPIERLFGGWNNLLRELECDINMNKDATKEDVSKAILDLYKEYGYITAELQRKKSGYSQPVIDRLFGSFSDMLRELKIREPYGKAITDEEVKKSILKIYKKHKYISCQLINEYCAVSDATIINRFGSLQTICDELNIPLHTNDDISKLSKFVIGAVSELLNAQPKYEYTFDWLINKDTRKKLRVDAYYPTHNLIIEVDGDQHKREGNNFFYKTKEEFEYACYLDELKETLIKTNKINFIRFNQKETLKTIKEKLSTLSSS